MVRSLDITCEGMWILQGLLGIGQLPINLALLPYITAGGTDAATTHPGVQTLRDAGVLSGADEIHPDVEHWLRMLGHPEIELAIRVDGPVKMRASIVRSGAEQVAAVRVGDDLCVYPLPAMTSFSEVAECAQSILPAAEPAVTTPVAMPARALETVISAMIADPETTPRRHLERAGVKAEQATLLADAVDSPTRETSFVLVTYADGEPDVHPVGAAVTDTENGRLVMGPLAGSGDGEDWIQIQSGTTAKIVEAVCGVETQMPPRTRWFSPRLL
ncbi:ESX secretion-associated protein EspG [Tsukamurella sp. 8F]|uniref:ESX secretion-associated protein EspG n=1 Tax=unclassified Tsukamurella TaxID=2633480 RepID=UPI0023B9CB73|nr:MULTISPECIES: ESX secretion-associated protein EspG [unclassified Tsukamurella]MDF0531141.1 ESX secretion-associated protein EspG [Tsukamurella sp. 8J]MDF0588387.1 ESX secretion-associated protein EspG [Tsukamurella sp. 8F]